MSESHFRSPSGLQDTDNFSTAWDMAALARYAMWNPRFRAVVRTKIKHVPWAAPTYEKIYVNKNHLIGEYTGANGIKTGWTVRAGYCLVSSATKDGLTLISVLLGAKDANTRVAESKALLLYGFDRSRLTRLVDRGQLIAQVPVPDVLGRDVRVVTARPYTRRLLGEDEVTAQVKLSGEIKLPVQAGQVLGELRFSQGEIDLGSVPLIAARSVEVATIRMILDHLNGPWAKALALTKFLNAVPG